MSQAKDPGSDDKSDLKRAIALHYQRTDELPKIVASGIDEIADRIIKLAEEHNVPIHQDGALAELLGKLGDGASISRESFRLVAEVISFLYHMNEDWRLNHKQLAPLLEAANPVKSIGDNTTK